MYMTVSAAARALGVMPDSIREYERRGRLKAVRTTTGIRLFHPAEVERFRNARAKRQQTTVSR